MSMRRTQFRIDTVAPTPLMSRISHHFYLLWHSSDKVWCPSCLIDLWYFAFSISERSNEQPLLLSKKVLSQAFHVLQMSRSQRHAVMELDSIDERESLEEQFPQSTVLWAQTESFLRRLETVNDSINAVFVFDFDRTLTWHAMSSEDASHQVDERVVVGKLKPYVVEQFHNFVRTQNMRGNLTVVLSFCSSRILQQILQRHMGGLTHGQDLLLVCPDNCENKKGYEAHDECNLHPDKPHRNMKYRFLHRLLERTGVEPNRVLFFDDRKKHVRALKALGVHAIRVYDFEHPLFRIETDPVFRLMEDFRAGCTRHHTDPHLYGLSLKQLVRSAREQISEEDSYRDRAFPRDDDIECDDN